MKKIYNTLPYALIYGYISQINIHNYLYSHKVLPEPVSALMMHDEEYDLSESRSGKD